MMANGDLLLDTNTVSAALKHEPAVVDRIARANGIAIPSTVLGELFFGAFQSARREDNLRTYEAIALNNAILPCDAATARIYMGPSKLGYVRRGTQFPIMTSGLPRWPCSIS